MNYSKSFITNYYKHVSDTADDIVRDMFEELKEEYNNYGSVIDTIQEYIDGEFEGTDTLDHVLIIEQSDYVEDDSGLWEEQEPIKAVETQAFFTFRWDVRVKVELKLEDIYGFYFS